MGKVDDLMKEFEAAAAERLIGRPYPMRRCIACRYKTFAFEFDSVEDVPACYVPSSKPRMCENFRFVPPGQEIEGFLEAMIGYQRAKARSERAEAARLDRELYGDGENE